jgi:hypothetical protein
MNKPRFSFDLIREGDSKGKYGVFDALGFSQPMCVAALITDADYITQALNDAARKVYGS